MSTRAVRRPSRLRLLLTFSALGIIGCASTTEAPAPRSGATASASLTESMTEAIGADPTRSFVASENGLEVRKWIVEDSPNLMAAAVLGYAEPAPVSDALRSRLQRNGLRFLRVPITEVESFQRALGGAALDLKTWYGQVPDWQELHRRSIGDQPRAVGVDGRVRGFVRGSFGFLMRSWTVQTEDGPRLVFQLAPAFSRDADPLQRLLNQEQFEGELFASIAFEHLLERGYAYILTCEGPSVDWERLANASAGSTPDDAGGASARSGGGVGPLADVGPAAIAPLSLGEMLLRGEAAGGNRGVIVLIPRVPEVLFPRELRNDRAASGAVNESVEGGGS